MMIFNIFNSLPVHTQFTSTVNSEIFTRFLFSRNDETTLSLSDVGKIMLQLRNFNVANMSFNAIHGIKVSRKFLNKQYLIWFPVCRSIYNS